MHRSGSAHFDNAHSEPVTLGAETGVPAALAATAAACALFVGLLARRRLGPSTTPARNSIDALFATLLAVALLSLADFPLRIAVASGPAAFFAGVALRRDRRRRRSAGHSRARRPCLLRDARSLPRRAWRRCGLSRHSPRPTVRLCCAKRPRPPRRPHPEKAELLSAANAASRASSPSAALRHGPSRMGLGAVPEGRTRGSRTRSTRGRSGSRSAPRAI